MLRRALRARRAHLQRLFSTFPNRWPGLGLLLLRCAAGGAAISQSVRCLSTGTSSGWQNGALVALGIGGVLLIVGLLTPLACSLILASYMGFAFVPSAAPCHLAGIVLVQTLATTIAIALLGPGALSIDSRLFGRREIIIPDSDINYRHD